MWGVALLAPLSLALGYVGYRSLPQGPLSPPDALFATLQLFVLEAPRREPGAPGILTVARFTAPLTLALATAVAVLSIVGEQARRATLKWRGREHVVVLGLSDSSADLVRRLREQGETVAVVESDADHPSLPSIRAQGAITIAGDARQPVILKRARSGEARHVIVTTGDDSRNLEICERLSSLASHEHRTAVHAAIRDESLWAELDRMEFETGAAGLTLDFFNAIDREAATFLELLDAESVPPGVAGSIVFEGDGVVAERVLLRMVRRAAVDRRRLQIRVSRTTDEAVIRPLLRREPWIADVADLVGLAVEPSSEAPAIAMVCMSHSDALGLSTALRLAKDPTLERVYVGTTRQDGRALLDLKGLSERIRIIPSGTMALDPDFFLHQSGIELMARARHEDYCANEIARGVTSATNPSLKPWNALPSSLKESNLNFARAVSGVIGQRGARLVPLSGPPQTPSFLHGEDLEKLARAEHDRWMTDLKRDGWAWGPAPKDPDRKTHPLLVEWDELSEPEREKDRDGIRAIPLMLARAGYAISMGSDERGYVTKA
jgi:hypothetical protein